MVLVKMLRLPLHTNMNSITTLKKYTKHRMILFVSALSFLFAVTPLTSLAFASPADGGLDVLAVPCTCIPAPTTWNVFVPLYVNSVVPTSGALLFVFGTEGYEYYIVHPGAWQLGIFIPGAQCLIGFPPFCFPLPSLGAISPLSGSSL